MGPTAQAPVKRATYDGSRPRFQSLQAWLNVYGNAEYAIYKRDAAPNPLSYDDWSSSEHVLGPFLWYTTLDVWEEDSASDEESEVEAPVPPTTRAPLKQQSKKTALTNGHGKRGPVKLEPSAALSKVEDEANAAKRKRKPKKPYLSEDIVVSDVSDETEQPAPVTGAPLSTVPAPNSPANGRRKSGGRKKKQYLSAETIAPEDEDDDPGATNRVPSAASFHESSAPAEDNIPVVAATPELPKSKRGRKSKKKSLSQTIISRDDENVGAFADAATTPKNAAASPEGLGSSSRRGLRTRTPAQQRPYFHNAQEFDDLVSDEPSPPKGKQRLKLTNLIKMSRPEDTVEVKQEREQARNQTGEVVEGVVEEEKEDKIDEEEETMLVDDSDGDEVVLNLEERRIPRKPHYKGKGRAWKKTSDDEDDDYRSPNRSQPSQPKKKLGRSKSIQKADLTTEVPEHEESVKSHRENEQELEQFHPATQTSMQLASKKQRKPRRSHHLSEEFVREDSDATPGETKETETKMSLEKRQAIASANPVQKTPKSKSRGRPRKSNPDSVPNGSATNDPGSLASSKDATPAKRKSPPKKLTPRKSAEVTPLSGANENENDPNTGSDLEIKQEALAVKSMTPDRPATPPSNSD